MTGVLEIEEGQSRSIKQLWGKLWHYWVQHVLSWYLHHNVQSQDVFSSAKALILAHSKTAT
jgi:hypothetical protein